MAPTASNVPSSVQRAAVASAELARIDLREKIGEGHPLCVSAYGAHDMTGNVDEWTFRDVTELGKGLAESGHLVIGFGIPWLAGDLQPEVKS